MWHNSDVKIVSNELSLTTTPSCVSFTDRGIIVGNGALAQKNKSPENTFFDAKRLIGTEYRLNSFKYLLFPINYDHNRRPFFEIRDENSTQKIYPEEISAIVLKTIKDGAERRLNQKIL